MELISAAHAIAMYDAWLDDGPLTVLDGISYTPSSLRKGLPPIAYQGGLLSWLAARRFTVDWARDWS